LTDRQPPFGQRATETGARGGARVPGFLGGAEKVLGFQPTEIAPRAPRQGQNARFLPPVPRQTPHPGAGPVVVDPSPGFNRKKKRAQAAANADPRGLAPAGNLRNRPLRQGFSPGPAKGGKRVEGTRLDAVPRKPPGLGVFSRRDFWARGREPSIRRFGRVPGRGYAVYSGPASGAEGPDLFCPVTAQARGGGTPLRAFFLFARPAKNLPGAEGQKRLCGGAGLVGSRGGPGGPGFAQVDRGFFAKRPARTGPRAAARRKRGPGGPVVAAPGSRHGVFLPAPACGFFFSFDGLPLFRAKKKPRGRVWF